MVTASDDFSGDRTSVSYLSPLQSSDSQGDAVSDGSLTESLFTKKPSVKEEEEEEEWFEREHEAHVQVTEEFVAGGFPAARPMECLKEAGPPPFLNKTYEMVDDPKTDCVVSWSKNRHSFVVWDAHEFSKILLPKYFKHSNISSFIRQLNTYGFKKVDPDRWEFANEEFQEGKRHLLKNIKRRSKHGARDNHHRPISSSEIDGLKHDHDSLQSEITRLRQQQNESRRQIESVEERIRFTECRHSQTLVFLTKVVSDPGFVRRIMARKRTKKAELEGVQCRKRNRVPVSPPVEDYLLDDQEFLSDTDSKFYNDLEDLMVEKPRDWACYMAGLVDQTSRTSHRVEEGFC